MSPWARCNQKGVEHVENVAEIVGSVDPQSDLAMHDSGMGIGRRKSQLRGAVLLMQPGHAKLQQKDDSKHLACAGQMSLAEGIT